MLKIHHLLAVCSILLWIASLCMAIQSQLEIAAILVPLSSAFMIGAVYAQRIYINRVLREEEQS